MRRFVPAMALIFGLQSTAFGMKSNCPWDLFSLLNREDARRVGAEPSVHNALHGILEEIYQNPPPVSKRLEDHVSVADAQWLSEYGLWPHAEEVAHRGRANAKQVKADRRRRILRKAALAVGGGVSLATGVWIYSRLKSEYLFDAPNSTLWDELGFYGQKPPLNWKDIRLLELIREMDQCDPNRGGYTLAQRLARDKSENWRIMMENSRHQGLRPQDVLALMITERALDFMDTSGDVLALRYHGVLICSRWGHPALSRAFDSGTFGRMQEYFSKAAELRPERQRRAVKPPWEAYKQLDRFQPARYRMLFVQHPFCKDDRISTWNPELQAIEVCIGGWRGHLREGIAEFEYDHLSPEEKSKWEALAQSASGQGLNNAWADGKASPRELFIRLSLITSGAFSFGDEITSFIRRYIPSED